VKANVDFVFNGLLLNRNGSYHKLSGNLTALSLVRTLPVFLDNTFESATVVI
jgi:hypothetical protein